MNTADPTDADTAAGAFHVGASSTSHGERRLHALKSGDTFGVFDGSGDIAAGSDTADGLYHHDTRHLSRFELRLNGAAPILLSSALRDNNATLTCDLTNPDEIRDDGRVALLHDSLHLRRSRFIFDDCCHERILVRNFADRPVAIELTLGFAADFADLFEARGMRRARHGVVRPPSVVAPDTVRLRYDGLDGRARETRLRFSPAPDALSANRATFRFTLEPQRRTVLHVEIGCDPATTAPSHSAGAQFLFSLVAARRGLRLSSARATALESSNAVFNEAIRRSISDLYMLVTDKPTGPFPYAGVPWYSTAFGRDAIITAMHALWIDPAIARGALLFLAANQADRLDPDADAEPGKILHEMRNGEMAELGEVPFRRYYGSIDATPLFVWLAGLYHERTGDLATARKLWPHVERALRWIDEHGDRDGDGFVEYGRRNADGLLNQGWKDSLDSVFHADGTLADGPIALCEVQGYVFAARRAAATLARALGDDTRAAALDDAAERLRVRFEDAFWCEELDTYALALDGAKRPCRVRSSNAGHLLLAGICDGTRARRVARGLMSRNFFSGYGIRTIAAGEPRYNPMAYHNGSIWPHDNALIALGFARHGLQNEAERVFAALFDAACVIEQRRLPELFCGFGREQGLGPVRYPVACSPQAWATTTLPALVQASLGIRFDPMNRTVHFERPRLPPFLDELTLHNLNSGGGRATVHLKRVGTEVALNVLSRDGDLRVQTTS